MVKRYLFCYDVADSKRLQKISRELEKLGVRVQYSFFEIETDRQKAEELYKKICSIADKNEDRVFMYFLDNDSQEISIGKIRSLRVV